MAILEWSEKWSVFRSKMDNVITQRLPFAEKKLQREVRDKINELEAILRELKAPDEPV